MYRIEAKINCLYYGIGSAVFQKTADKFYIFMLKVPRVAINKIAYDVKYRDLRPKMLFAINNGYLASTLTGTHYLGISHGDFKWDNVFDDHTLDTFFPIYFGLSGVLSDSSLNNHINYLDGIIKSVSITLGTTIDVTRARNPVLVNKNKVK
ncbi:hypothetical protein [Pigmentibacter ruber]|uniref:hypothetical protein n=1 Tax=Pigmentibacter ruber TaxID=2683196 RepID=UPI00131CDE44|nr:hypothetical protein [Pigmentibacter ruber]